MNPAPLRPDAFIAPMQGMGQATSRFRLNPNPACAEPSACCLSP